MLYIVYCKDNPNQVETRLSLYDAHKAYMTESRIKCLMSGPCVDEVDRQTPVGGFYLMEAENREAVEAWNRNDPFFQAGIWESIHIQPWHKRTDNLSAQ